MADLILKNKSNDLFNEMLLKPARSCNELSIISGYATPAMIEHHIEAIKKSIKIDLIVGMTPLSGISEANHRNFKGVMKRRPLVKCSYINANAFPVHSKVYIWSEDGRPKEAFISSANYTISAFLRQQDEVASQCDPNSAYAYYKDKIGFSVYCTEPETESFVYKEELLLHTIVKDTLSSREDADYISESEKQRADNIKLLPLFSKTKGGSMQKAAGLNWGQREAKKADGTYVPRNPNEAYIPVPIEIARSGFFPPKGQEFSVITNDGFSCICVIAQANDKAIETKYDNSELGRYFRHKLGLEEGAFVTLDDLKKFRNLYVKFIKINDEEYIMDFSRGS